MIKKLIHKQMKSFTKIILCKFLILFCTIGFSSNYTVEPASISNLENSSYICLPALSVTATLLSSLPCSKYQFNVTLGTRQSFTISYGDGSPNVVLTFPPPIAASLTFVHQYSVSGTYTVTAIVAPGCAAPITQTLTVNVTCGPVPCPSITSFTNIKLSGVYTCEKFEVNANLIGYSGPSCPTSTLVATFNFGDGSPTVTSCPDAGGAANAHEYLTAGSYTVTLTITGPGTCVATATQVITVTCTALPCADCIPSFAPIPGKKYILSAWVKEDNALQSKTSYTFPRIYIIYPSLSFTSTPYSPAGQIIDGWQRIEGEFLIPVLATNLSLKLDCSSGNCFFDDVRVFPFDGSMKSYVYDPVTMRLVAELDERNYATLYEYDDEGKLIRVKKETEKGKMTIQENRNNTKK